MSNYDDILFDGANYIDKIQKITQTTPKQLNQI